MKKALRMLSHAREYRSERTQTSAGKRYIILQQASDQSIVTKRRRMPQRALKHTESVRRAASSSGLSQVDGIFNLLFIPKINPPKETLVVFAGGKTASPPTRETASSHERSSLG
jgi:hypothetical protein